MMLVDSNIVIYAAQPEHIQLRRFIAEHVPAVSAISYVEVLGYHQLDDQDRQYFEQFFRLSRVLPLSQAVLDQAVALRQQRRMSLGDALIAGTALVHDLTLATRNMVDFHWIQGLSLLNPFEAEPRHEQEQQGEDEGSMNDVR
jgi:predicted nucleic acid-binding protein